MSRSVLIVLLLALAAASAAAPVLVVNPRDDGKPALTEAQRAAREKSFGSGRELPPIKDGQEMLPRW